MRPPVLNAMVALVLTAAPLVAQDTANYSPLPTIDLPPALERVLRDYESAWQAGDEVALADLFTADGFVPSGPGWVRGSEDILSTYTNSSGPLQLRGLAYAVDDTVGYLVGAYGYGEAGGPDRGKFLLALRREPGGPWLIAADLDSSNR